MNNDLISREVIKKDIEENSIVFQGVKVIEVECAKVLIDNAPTITPSLNLDNITEADVEKFKMIWQRATSKGLLVICEDRPHGEWIIEHDWVHCSSCGHEQNYPSNFCPNCGADMRGDKNA